MRAKILVGALLIPVALLAQTASEDPTRAVVVEAADLKARAEAVVTLSRNVEDPDEATEAIREAFGRIQERELQPDRLSSYDTRTLEILFEAVAVASERLQRPDLLGAMEDIFQESLRRGFLGGMVERLYMEYVHQRHWSKARRLDERFPMQERDLPRIVQPEAIRDGVRAVYRVSEDGETLTYTPVDLAGPVVVSVVSPWCHFSEEIVQVIESDPSMAALFADHALNIEPASYHLNVGELAQANREGGIRYVLLHRGSDWKGFDFSSTPQFYFVKDGAILHRIHSVEPEDFRTALEEGLAKIGLRLQPKAAADAR